MKKTYEYKLLAKSKNNNKKTWSTLKSICGLNKSKNKTNQLL